MRRLLNLTFAFYAIFAMAAGPTSAATAPEATVNDLCAALLQTMKHGRELGQKGRYDALAPEIRRSFDLRTMARMAVGLTWPRLSPDEQGRVTEAFARYTITAYANRFDSYSGETFDVAGQRSTPFGTIIASRIVPSSGAPVGIDDLLRQNGDRWQITDVYLTGAVSEVATLRAIRGGPRTGRRGRADRRSEPQGCCARSKLFRLLTAAQRDGTLQAR